MSSTTPSSSSRCVFSLLLICCFHISALVSSFSVHYAYDEKKDHAAVIRPAGRPIHFAQSPSPEQVADLYTRATGRPPLLTETSFTNLPSTDMLSAGNKNAVLLEINGGVLPPGLGMTSIAQSSAGPSLDDVVNVLNREGVRNVDVKKMSASSSSSSSIVNFVKQHSQPVFIIHHPTTHEHLDYRRRLANATNTTPPTEYEISSYQICLWTGIGMIALVACAISSLSSMEIIPDSLLFAKFQSSRTNKSD